MAEIWIVDLLNDIHDDEGSPVAAFAAREDAEAEGQRLVREGVAPLFLVWPIELRGYDPSARRAAEHIVELTSGAVGGGDDPVGFLVASHAAQREELERARAALRRLEQRLSGDDLVDRKQLRRLARIGLGESE